MKSTFINNQVVCHYCNQDGHMKNRCPMKRNAYYGVKSVWVPKRQLLTFKKPRSFGYLKLKKNSSRIKKKEQQVVFG